MIIPVLARLVPGGWTRASTGAARPTYSPWGYFIPRAARHRRTRAQHAWCTA